jgi:DNA-binding GntR family transcriptional regulator
VRIRCYANAFPQSLDRARRDHLDMIKALRGGRRDESIALTRRHLKPSPEAYIKAYDAHSALLTSLIRGSVASVRLW